MTEGADPLRPQLAALGARAARAGAGIVPEAAAALGAVLLAKGVPGPVVAGIEAAVAALAHAELVRAGVLQVESGVATIVDKR